MVSGIRFITMDLPWDESGTKKGRETRGGIERPALNRDEGSTLAFAKAQARKLLDLPSEETVAGLRDRAILSVGLQVGCGGPRSPRSRSAICTRTAAMIHCASCAKAAVATHWRSIRPEVTERAFLAHKRTDRERDGEITEEIRQNDACRSPA